MSIYHSSKTKQVHLSRLPQYGVEPDTLRRALMRNGSGEANGPLGVLSDALATMTN